MPPQDCCQVSRRNRDKHPFGPVAPCEALKTCYDNPAGIVGFGIAQISATQTRGRRQKIPSAVPLPQNRLFSRPCDRPCPIDNPQMLCAFECAGRHCAVLGGGRIHDPSILERTCSKQTQGIELSHPSIWFSFGRKPPYLSKQFLTTRSAS